MAFAHQTRLSPGANLRKVLVCLLLAIVSLYNPFLTISGACELVHVHHPLSFRATIASCELGRCTLDDDKPLTAAPDALETTDAMLVVPQTAPSFPTRQDHDVVVPLQQVTAGGLWFRPPPSL